MSWRRRTLWQMPRWRYNWARDCWVNQETGAVALVRHGKLVLMISDFL